MTSITLPDAAILSEDRKDPVQEYFEFARDIAHLDVTSHQANDFHLTNDFWRHLNEAPASFSKDDRFIVFPGYEWSANTPLGGDHNVFLATQADRSSGRRMPCWKTDPI